MKNAFENLGSTQVENESQSLGERGHSAGNFPNTVSVWEMIAS
jgi:hypothetical protein